MDAIWYGKGWGGKALLPLSWLFCALVRLRRRVYRGGLLSVVRLPVPVLVIGNLTVGGTGKTPLVVWMVEVLRREGLRPAVLSRGYGGRSALWPQWVAPDSDPGQVGDEPVLLARRCGCPVAVGPDRVAAARMVLAQGACGVLVSDDGLQHYALGRDLEIAVVDGLRRFGNGHCLPAGPLREPLERLREVDVVVANGVAAPGELEMRIEAREAVSLAEGRALPLAELRGRSVHAVAGIAHPQRFFRMLRGAGLELVEHPFPDHHRFRVEDLRFGDGLPVLMTEKDAVKCAGFAIPGLWYVPISAALDAELGPRIVRLLEERTHG